MATQNAIGIQFPASVPNGGTGITTVSTSTNKVICAGTTSTNSFQPLSSNGFSGQVLTSNGASALPSFQANPLDTGAAAFVVFDATGASPAILNDLNVSSVTSSAAGAYHINFNLALSSANYAAFMCAQPVSGANSYDYVFTIGNAVVTPTTPTTSGYDVLTNLVISKYVMTAVYI